MNENVCVSGVYNNNNLGNYIPCSNSSSNINIEKNTDRDNNYYLAEKGYSEDLNLEKESEYI